MRTIILETNAGTKFVAKVLKLVNSPEKDAYPSDFGIF